MFSNTAVHTKQKQIKLSTPPQKKKVYVMFLKLDSNPFQNKPLYGRIQISSTEYYAFPQKLKVVTTLITGSGFST